MNYVLSWKSSKVIGTATVLKCSIIGMQHNHKSMDCMAMHDNVHQYIYILLYYDYARCSVISIDNLCSKRNMYWYQKYYIGHIFQGTYTCEFRGFSCYSQKINSQSGSIWSWLLMKSRSTMAKFPTIRKIKNPWKKKPNTICTSYNHY